MTLKSMQPSKCMSTKSLFICFLDIQQMTFVKLENQNFNHSKYFVQTDNENLNIFSYRVVIE